MKSDQIVDQSSNDTQAIAKGSFFYVLNSEIC